MVENPVPYWHSDADYTACPFFIRRMDTRGNLDSAQIPVASIPLIGFLFLSDGEALVEADGRSFVLSSGHLLLIPQNQRFAIHFYENAIGFSGGFDPSAVPHSAVVRTLVKPVHKAFWFDEGVFVGHLFKMLLLSYEKEDNAFIEKGIELLLCCLSDAKAPSLPPMVSSFFDMLFRANEVPADISSYSEALGISNNYLSRTVKDATGKSVGTWIDIARVSIAKRLLKETDLPIIDVASRVGLYDQSYFSRFFKRQSGISPSAFRKAMQG